MRVFLFFFFLLTSLLFAKEVVVDLNQPSYENGHLSTEHGGVITSKNLRIQAKRIEYIHKIENGEKLHSIKASENLMLQYNGKVFTGEELDFDFIKNTGMIYEGRTYISPWYIKGETIELKEDGNYQVINAYATTCVDKESNWDLKAKRVNIIDKERIRAKDITFRVFSVPTLWLPFYKVNLQKFSDPSLLQYKMTWDKGVGPRATIRYQIYSWKNWAFFTRLDFRLKRDYGGAFETEYFSDNKRSQLITKNYLARDILPTDPKNTTRYRYQGDGFAHSLSGKTNAYITWDKYSDIHMPTDFKSEDFEINPAKKTEVYLRHQEDHLIALFRARGRANPFESLKQDLPTAFLTYIPYRFPKLGIYSKNFTKGAYLDFAYSEDLETNLSDFKSFRLESHHELYRPIQIKGFTFTPSIGAVGVFYSDSPLNDTVGLGVLKYGATFLTRLFRSYQTTNHILTPYIEYQGLSKPTASFDRHYIFSLQDGYNRLNELKLGVRSLLSFKTNPNPFFTIDLYANAYFSDLDIPQTFPKLYLDLTWLFPKLEINFYNAWNFRHQVIDYSNFRAAFTVNENFAFKFNIRYRSQYDWRKADHTNFILDVSRKENELLSSPISDRRITLLTDLFFRFSPYWHCHIQSHHGWYRINEPPYNEVKADLFTTISSTWQVQLSYWHTQTDDRFSVGINLISGK